MLARHGLALDVDVDEGIQLVLGGLRRVFAASGFFQPVRVERDVLGNGSLEIELRAAILFGIPSVEAITLADGVIGFGCRFAFFDRLCFGCVHRALVVQIEGDRVRRRARPRIGLAFFSVHDSVIVFRILIGANCAVSRNDGCTVRQGVVYNVICIECLGDIDRSFSTVSDCTGKGVAVDKRCILVFDFVGCTEVTRDSDLVKQLHRAVFGDIHGFSRRGNGYARYLRYTRLIGGRHQFLGDAVQLFADVNIHYDV